MPSSSVQLKDLKFVSRKEQSEAGGVQLLPTPNSKRNTNETHALAVMIWRERLLCLPYPVGQLHTRESEQVSTRRALLTL